MSVENFWSSFKNRITGFYNNNRKSVNYIGGALVLIIALFAFAIFYLQPKREAAAGLKLSKLYHYFESDSFAVVVNGIKGKKMATAPEIADEYFFTNKGKEAALMAGESYLHLAKWDKALKYLNKASADDIILGPSILAARATCYSELGDISKAAKTFEKAAKWGNNDFTAQYYKKAGVHCAVMK
jgi:tetratricopeptide (TPR) repeat protein